MTRQTSAIERQRQIARSLKDQDNRMARDLALASAVKPGTGTSRISTGAIRFVGNHR